MTDNSTQGQGKTWLYLIVFLTGASVMIIELLGTRLIAPFYGASLYVLVVFDFSHHDRFGNWLFCWRPLG